MSKKIKKANMLHSILYRTYPDSTMIRYSIALFFSGIVLLILSFMQSNEKFTQVLGMLSEVLFMLSLYTCPFWTPDDVEKAINTFSKWLFLLICSVLYGVLWYTVCNSIQYKNFLDYLISILITIVEIIFLLRLFNLIIKFIQNVSKTVSEKIQSYAQQKNENRYSTFIKKALANSSTILTFFINVLSVIKLTINVSSSLGVFGDKL